jgi:long-chain acyl-CoA synthetase
MGMNFLEAIFERLRQTPSKPILQEIRGGELVPTTCGELLGNIGRARQVLTSAGLRPGDRCVLLGPNSGRWVALDLAIMAEGGIGVPLYSRQAPEELASMMKDCSPTVACYADADLRGAVTSRWPEAPPALLFDEVFGTPYPSRAREQAALFEPAVKPLIPSKDDTPITIIYTSGTSGEAKGVVLNVGNLSFMLQRTAARLEELMQPVEQEEDRVFHYLPFCFAGSRILLLTCLFRNKALTLSADLNKLSDELKITAPHYFLNVPALLERIRTGIIVELRKRGGVGQALLARAQAAWFGRHNGQKRILGSICLKVAEAVVFPKIKQRLGPNLQALICGSAPLAEETQLFFQMIGVPVLQVYGLTETTAICTMDEVDKGTVGRVGPAIPGTEMRAGENDEILVRGPHVFPGYWGRPLATAEVIKEGWLHTGDQGHVDDLGNWKIIGRLKNLIITSGGHNISPEPIEQKLLRALPEGQQVMVVGNGRKFLSAIVTGEVRQERIKAAVERVNRGLPHYKQIRKFYLSSEAFSAENGLLTANRKLKRTAIETRYKEQIENLYRE